MKKSLMILTIICCAIFMFSRSLAQQFPPAFQPGPFPFGTEEVRNDAPVDENDPDGVIHEYTAYKGTVVVDGDLSDPAWDAIPWTLMEFNFDVPSSEEGSMWSEDYSPSGWDAWEDLTCWFKIIHDDENIYMALLRYDDDYNTEASLLTSPGSMWMYDAYQFIIDTRYPGDIDTESPGAEIGVCFVDGEEAYTFWATSHQNPATQLELAEGDCESSSSSTAGKAIHGSLEENTEYLIERIEAAFVKYDVMADDDVGMLSLCALDKDFDVRESVIQWAQGLYVKTPNEYGSILWSSQPVPSAGEAELVAHWTFNEMSGTTAIDVSGNGNDGTINGANWIVGKVGAGALSFDGASNYVEVPYSASLDITEEITVSAWINIAAIEGGQNVLQKEFFAIGEMRNGDGVLKNVINIGGSWIVEPYTQNAADYIGEWHHIAMTFDGTNMINYFDGQVDGEFEHAGTIQASTAALGIGYNSPWGDAKFNGDIDDVRIYNYALDQSEILSMFTTRVELGSTEMQADEFELAQNYPNPFNPVTTITYYLPKNSIVTLKIYNTIGEEVATIIDQKPMAAGSYKVDLDGSNLSSGIYLYQLKCGTTVINKKMTLLK